MTKVPNVANDVEPLVVVNANNVSVIRGNRVSLDNISFELKSHTLTAVIGPNGAGKSTLLHAITGLLPLNSGTIKINNIEVIAGQVDAAYVLQGTAIPPNLPMSVREVVAMGRYRALGFFRRLKAHDHALINEAMDRLEITDLASRQLMQLSGGQRQRVYVAQGLVQGSPLLLLDEPVTGLDIVSRERILAVVQEERQAGVAVVMTTHDLNEAATADQVLLLANRLVAAGPPDKVLTSELVGEAFGQRFVQLGTGILIDTAHHHD